MKPIPRWVQSDGHMYEERRWNTDKPSSTIYGSFVSSTIAGDCHSACAEDTINSWIRSENHCHNSQGRIDVNLIFFSSPFRDKTIIIVINKGRFGCHVTLIILIINFFLLLFEIFFSRIFFLQRTWRNCRIILINTFWSGTKKKTTSQNHILAFISLFLFLFVWCFCASNVYSVF